MACSLDASPGGPRKHREPGRPWSRARHFPPVNPRCGLNPVRPYDEPEQIVETVGREHHGTAVRQPHADRGRRRRSGYDGVFGRGVGHYVVAESLPIPQVHPRLVLDVDRDREAGHRVLHPCSNRVLALFGQIAGIEVDDVVVTDVAVGSLSWAAFHTVCATHPAPRYHRGSPRPASRSRHFHRSELPRK